MSNIQAIVCTCKKYEDVAAIFERKVNLQFLTKLHCTYFTDYPLNLDIRQVAIDGDISWSKRIADSLEFIDSEYILLLLDDYYIRSDFDLNLITSIIKIYNPDYIRLVNVPHVNSVAFGVQAIPFDLPYGINLQFSCWKKEFLREILLKINSNPWATELNLARFFKVGTDGNFQGALTFDVGANILNGVIKGKWNRAIIVENFLSLESIVGSNLPLMSRGEDILYRLRVFLSVSIKSKTTRLMVKSVARLLGFKFLSKE